MKKASNIALCQKLVNNVVVNVKQLLNGCFSQVYILYTNYQLLLCYRLIIIILGQEDKECVTCDMADKTIN